MRTGLEKSPVWLSGTSKYPGWTNNILTSLAQWARVRVRHLVIKSLAKTSKQLPWASEMWELATCPLNKLEFKLFLSPDHKVLRFSFMLQ